MLRPHEAVAVSLQQAALLVLIAHFAFRLIESPNLIAFEDSPRLTLELFC
jgi:hypothetical protein